MSKTGPELRHEAKQRMEKYRAQMIEKGYISTTIFLSHEHRAELKHLGDEHKLTRAESAEHIFQVYQQSENKEITQSNNTNTIDQTETIARLEFLEARLKALENQAGKTEDMPETEDNNGFVLEVAIEKDMDREIDVSETVIEQSMDTAEPVVYDDLILEPDNSEDKDITQTDNIKQKTETPVTPEPESTDKPIQESQTEIFDAVPEPVEPKPDQNMGLPDYLIGVNPEMTVEERHKIILRLAEDFPDRQNAQKRIDLLNAAGVLLGGKPWETTKQFGDQVSIARRWVKKNEKA